MRIMAIIKRISQQMLRDRRTLGLLFIAPLLVITLMYYFFNTDQEHFRIGVSNIDPRLQRLLEKDFSIETYETISVDKMVQDNLDAALIIKNEKFIITLLNDDPLISKNIQANLNQVVQIYTQQIKGDNMKEINIGELQLETHYIYGNSETQFFDVLSPVLVGFFVFFFVFLISGIGLLRERTTGTLERLMSTPVRRGEIVTAYLIGYGIFAIIQTAIVVAYSINVLDMVLVGSIWNVFMINIFLALVALSLGILLSAFASSEFQMMQFIPIVVIPQVFFTGIFPVEDMAAWLQLIGKIMPMTYAASALKGVMYKGYTLGEITGELSVLGTFAVVFIILNIFALKKYRTL